MTALATKPSPPDPRDLIGLRVRERPDVVLVTVTGNLDVYTARVVRERVEPCVGSRAIVVDLTGVDLLDSAGVKALSSIANRLVRAGGHLGVVDGRFRRLFEITGMLDRLVCAAHLRGVQRRLEEAGSRRRLRAVEAAA